MLHLQKHDDSTEEDTSMVHRNKGTLYQVLVNMVIHNINTKFGMLMR